MKALLELFRGLTLRTDPLYLVSGSNQGVRRFSNHIDHALDWAQCGLVGERVTITRIGCFTNKVVGVYTITKDSNARTGRTLLRIL